MGFHDIEYFSGRFVQGKHIKIRELERYLKGKTVTWQDKAHGLILLGHLRSEKELYSEAREAYEKALVLDPDYRNEVEIWLAEISAYSGIKEGVRKLQRLRPDRMCRGDKWLYWEIFVSLACFSWDAALIAKVISNIRRENKRDTRLRISTTVLSRFLKFFESKAKLRKNPRESKER